MSAEKAVPQASAAEILFNSYLAQGKILVRYALVASPRSEEFWVEIVDLEKPVFGGKEYQGLVCFTYRGGIFGTSIKKRELGCQIIGPFGPQEDAALNAFRAVEERWKNLGDPVVNDGKCLWMEPEGFVGCVKPRGDMKGLPNTFPASSSSWVFPFLCLFAGQFRSLVFSCPVRTLFEVEALENCVARFHSFFVHEAWYRALNKPTG